MQVKIIADTIANDARITTFQLRYWRAIHAEFMTHRVFSRNASSSRGIPISATIQQVVDDPAGPTFWGKNKAGMQAVEQVEDVEGARQWWLEAAASATEMAKKGEKLGLHKQIVNRVLEPFQYINVLVTSTEWDNFFALRQHEDAQPEIRELATAMKFALDNSSPAERSYHLPYITDEEFKLEREKFRTFVDHPSLAAYASLAPISAARCCRVSYNKHDGTPSTRDEDMRRFYLLVDPSHPLHASPLEHQAFESIGEQHRNFFGWAQYREAYESKMDL